MLAKVPKRTKLICYDATSLKPVYLPVPAVLPHKKHIVTGLRAVKAGPVAVRCWSPLSLESKTRDLSIMCYVQMTIKKAAGLSACPAPVTVSGEQGLA